MKKKAFIIRKLSYRYNGEYVLKRLNFSIFEGSFSVIIGPNGSGKTTLLRLISGLEKIEHGSIKIMGSNIRNYNIRQLSKILAYVPQSISIDFPFKVYEFVYMGRSPHLGLFGIGSSNDREIVKEAMKFTGIDNLENRMMFQLSGGELQRVFIARAISQQTSIIVLDEPTAALDIAHQISLMDLMEKLVNEKNVTIIMVSHDINLAAMYCDNLLIIKSGLIIKKGKPNEVLKFDILEETYGCSMIVDESPFDNIPRIIPVPNRYFKSNM